MTNPLDRGPILLYDGLCGFCDGAVQFVLHRDPHRRLRFAALQGPFARGVMARHPELASIDSLILVEPDALGGERVSVRSEGALRVARYLGGAWRATGLLRVFPRGLRDWAYDTFARNRYRWFKRLEACRVPTAAEREQFVD